MAVGTLDSERETLGHGIGAFSSRAEIWEQEGWHFEGPLDVICKAVLLEVDRRFGAIVEGRYSQVQADFSDSV